MKYICSALVTGRKKKGIFFKQEKNQKIKLLTQKKEKKKNTNGTWGRGFVVASFSKGVCSHKKRR
jgi:hypothetical protein